MKTCILLPGKIKPKVLSSAQEEYMRRLRPFGVDVDEYKTQKVAPRAPEQTKELEAERILKRVKAGDFLVACDERGNSIQTKDIAEWIKASRLGTAPLAGKSRLVLVVGGALGLSDAVRQRADAVWSLSSLVMAGGVARLVLLEGLYRAFTMVDGHPYHNE
jgi:23S rRNA (pseudouridine1915-N3)-methyltransferase